MPLADPLTVQLVELGESDKSPGLSVDQVPAAYSVCRVDGVAGASARVPVIGLGASGTVSVLYAFTTQPVLYVITALPGEIPVTMPVALPTVAIAGLLLLHVPPVTVLLSVAVVPGHTLLFPVIVAGAGLTVTTMVLVTPP